MKAAPVDPILVVDLFPDMRAELLTLLLSLTTDEWNLPSICEGWSVKDIAGHLLGDQVGLLSRQRDDWPLSANINGWDELIAFINKLNDTWVQAARRISPQLLCALLQFTGDMMDRHFQSLDLFAPGSPVSWAGPEPAPMWMGIAREYSEYWIHQQHIRDAVGRPGLKDRRFFAPLLETFVRALPHTFRLVAAPNLTTLKLVIFGEAGSVWYLVREDAGWQLYRDTDLEPACIVSMDAETAWRLFTRGISQGQAKQRMTIVGDQALGLTVLNTVSILA